MFHICTGLHGKSVQLHSHSLSPTQVKFKAHVWYVARLKHCMVCFPFLIHSFSTLLVTLFTIAQIKCPARLYSTFDLFFLLS